MALKRGILKPHFTKIVHTQEYDESTTQGTAIGSAPIVRKPVHTPPTTLTMVPRNLLP
ncbi:MAG: hypothetical protein ACO3QB_13940 [bacterium]